MLICPNCKENGQRSIVDMTGSKTPQVPKRIFWDEDGQEHVHNPNVSRTQYRCSNGHRFEEFSSWECHCGYKACEAKLVPIGSVTSTEVNQ